MARNKQPRFTNNNGNDSIILTQGGTATGTIVAPTGGMLINFIIATNNDDNGTPPVVTLRILTDADAIVNELGAYSLTAKAGTNGTTDPDNLKSKLAFLDVDGAENPVLFITEGYKLQASATFTSADGDIVTVSIGYGILEEDA